MTAALLKAFGQACQALYAAQPIWDILLFAGILAAIPMVLTGWAPSGGARNGSCGSGGLSTRLDWALVLAFTVLGACLRLYGRGVLPYWWDELLAVWLSRSGFEVMLASLFTPSAPGSDFSPPLFYTLLAGWMRAFGPNEAATRMLTALFSASTVPMVYWVGRELLSRRVGLLASFLLSLSPLAVFYAQQVRCYSLLGLLSVLAAALANRAWRTGSTRDLLGFSGIGILFVFTHFVAAWAWFGLGLATALRLALRYWRDRGGRSAEPDQLFTVAAWAAGLALCLLCPLYWPSSLENPNAPVVLTLAGLTAAGLACLHPSGTDPGRAGFRPLLAAFLIPALAIAAWIVPSGVIGVIGGASAYVPGSYGQAEFSRFLLAFCGLQSDSLRAPVQLCLFLLPAGLFAFSLARPGECLLLLGWAGIPLTMAMLAQNANMNLTRYLFFALPAFLLLIAAAVDLAVSAFLGLPAWLSARSPGPGRSRDALVLLGGLLLAAGVFGYRAYTATPFPTMRADYEDYPGAAARLVREGRFLLVSESHNLTRALSWFMTRSGTESVTVQPESPEIFALNSHMDGRPWSPDLLAQARTEGAIPAGRFGEISLYEARFDPPGRPPLPANTDASGTSFSLSGDRFRLNMCQGRNIAVAGGAGLIPLFKDKPGSARYRVTVPAAPGQVLTLRPQGVVLGRNSVVAVTVGQDGDDPWEVRLELRPSDILRAELRPGANPEAVTRNGSSVSLRVPDSPEPVRSLRVDIELLDDHSGAIYSSNAALSSLEARFTPAPR